MYIALLSIIDTTWIIGRENVVNLYNEVLLSCHKQWYHEIYRQMDRIIKIQPGWGHRDVERQTWQGLTQKWILAVNYTVIFVPQ